VAGLPKGEHKSAKRRKKGGASSSLLARRWFRYLLAAGCLCGLAVSLALASS
jgi:hypothetical protein